MAIDATAETRSAQLVAHAGYSLTRCTPSDVPDALAHAEFVLVVTRGTQDTNIGQALCETVLDVVPDAGLLLLCPVAGQTNLEVVAEGSDHEGLQRLVDDLVAATRSNALAAPAPADPRSFEGIVGSSRPIRALCRLIERVAQSESSILIAGETGTGKELVARAIHRRSPRRDKPFVAINCAAIPEALLESDLFGHARGAFTGASTARQGLFQRARGGTVFFDEVGDMPLALQAKLLRALQEHTVRPVGSDDEVPIDLRVLAATHQDLEVATRDGRFREDLLYRLNVIQIEMPRLSDRGNDVLLVAEFFLDRFAARAGKSISGFSPAVAECLLAYDWPGNVRELSNCVERAVAISTRAELCVEDLSDKIQAAQVSSEALMPTQPAALVPLAEIERRYILRVLDLVKGNKARAARVLGLDRKTLYRKLNLYRHGGGDPS